MNPVLQKDTDIPFPHFMILKASAGSGKTYALTQRFVQFILSGRVHHNSLRNILAITFSNNAAKEMKERVLEQLKDAYFGEPDVLDELLQVISVSREQVREQAGALLEEILGNYSDFQVKTIDSFMATVFKASAIDFGYPPDFDIIINNQSLIDYTFNLIFRNISEHTYESVLFEQIIDDIGENRRSDASYLWDPTETIIEEVKNLSRKLSATSLRPLLKDERKEIDILKNKMKQITYLLDNLINNSQLDKSLNSSFDAVRTAVHENKFTDIFSRGLKLPPVKKPGGKAQALHDSYREILAYWSELQGLVSRFASLYSRSVCIPYMLAYGSFRNSIESIKRLHGKVFIEDINRYLAEYLRSDIVPDVYFRLGDIVYHFLIDEFQDTSPIQWQNLIPLIDNSLSQGGSLFVVGDTKQAIYGFRDADYTIMRDCISTNPFPSAIPFERELTINYRSRSRILDFTRRVFQGKVSGNPQYHEAATRSGLADYTQTPSDAGSTSGYVEVTLHQKNDESPPEKQKIQELMQELRTRGYSLGDIAVLTQRNEDAVRVTAWLNEIDIDFISFSSLDIRRRKLSGEIFSLLKFLDSPPEDLSFATFLSGGVFGRRIADEQSEQEQCDIRKFLFSRRNERPLYKAFRKTFPELWDTYFAGIFRSAGYLPLYDLVTQIFCVFRVFETFGEEESTLAKILESVKDLEGNGYSSIGDFLLFADEGQIGDIAESDWDMNVPKDYEAVRVMTIHKAKGLGFPVVILLLYDEFPRGFDYIIEHGKNDVRLLKVTRDITSHDPHSAELYHKETIRDRVNSLNALYVGFTRSQYELYVIGVRGKTLRYPLDILPADEFPPAEKPSYAESARHDFSSPVPLLHASGQIEFGAGPEELLNLHEKQRGEFIHRTLSLIDYAGRDISKKVMEITHKVKRETGAGFPVPEIHDLIVSLVRREDISGYFRRKPGRVVKTEWEVTDRAGRLHRMDRIVIDKDLITILDYKTGKERSAEEASIIQVMRYRKIAEELFPARTVECLLVYVDTGEMKRIS
ncbi:MAG: UvrD-helicase domain-containing protein [Nitrospirota bacterium]